ncbi:MAG: bifunctional pyr operon transcriptional regulator/uracil phosphoribosyltransferase PyrR [Desulfobacteraceae bacterium]|nr:bifunctional pyr operon transcriptional regulator/uracil phosphoribosyltransferase PyrR [Desulfobacteraceae bacterium]
MSTRKTICDTEEIEIMIDRMGREITESRRDIENLALVGIHTRGVYLARRLGEKIKKISSIQVPTGDMDINLYRDDWTGIGHQPEVRSTRIDFNVSRKQIILTDDVLYTGRTIRAALDAIIDFGRPLRIELAVLIDRNHRELPIQADYTGKFVETRREDVVNVLLAEYDGIDRVDLLTK